MRMDLWINLVMRTGFVLARSMLLVTNVMLVFLVFLVSQPVTVAMMTTMGTLIVNLVTVTVKDPFGQIVNMENVLVSQISSETNVTKLNLDITTSQNQKVPKIIH